MRGARTQAQENQFLIRASDPRPPTPDPRFRNSIMGMILGSVKRAEVPQRA
jgi:hypothetical protein